jgi:hypothetical protein
MAGKDIELEKLILEDVTRRGRPERGIIHHPTVFDGYSKERIDQYVAEMIDDGLVRGTVADRPSVGSRAGIESLTRKGEEYLEQLSASFARDVARAWHGGRGPWFWGMVGVLVGGALVRLLFG